MKEKKGRSESDVLNMQEGAVTWLDVLGWKGIWQRKPDAMKVLGDISDLVKKLQEIDVSQAGKFAGLIPTIRVISDTIQLTTYGKPRLVLPFHAVSSGWLLSFGLTVGLPIRGAIGYGLFSSMDNMLVGPAVDEVASWYEAVDWLGVIFTPTASFHYKKEDYEGDSVVEYAVPLGRGGRYPMKCLDWLGAIKDESDLLQSFLATASVVTPNVAPKYQNTVEFFRYIRKLKKFRRAAK